MRAAIVTGVSRGLGEAIAAALLGHGFRVCGIGRGLSARLERAGCQRVDIDFADVARIGECCATALTDLARVRPAYTVLVNNAAAVEPVGRFGRMPADALARALAINLVAPALLSNLFCRIFAGPDGERRIVNISSGAAQRAIPGAGHYSIAKAGLEMLTSALAADHAEPGFAAISVRPGVIDTGMQTYMREQSPDVVPAVPMFREFHRGGQLVAPDTTARVIVDRLILSPVEHGRTYSYQELAA